MEPGNELAFLEPPERVCRRVMNIKVAQRKGAARQAREDKRGRN